MESKENRETKFWTIVKRPLELCRKNKSRSCLWGIYVIFGGLLGVVINLITRWMCGPMSLNEALYVESVCGTFYTFSIVLISAAIGPLVFNLSESRILHFPDIKSFTLTISFFAMVLCAVFYSTLEDKVSTHLKLAASNGYTIDWPQLIFFLIGIIIALYCFGIEYLDRDPEHNKDIDSSAEFRDEADKRVLNLEKANPTNTGSGVRL
ncbi:MAG: hypothetical protein K2H85_03075 [Allobaculum sp.]|nr:hypothetical protein [Allobaculum sp.]